jgi:hypothetical protein
MIFPDRLLGIIRNVLRLLGRAVNGGASAMSLPRFVGSPALCVERSSATLELRFRVAAEEDGEWILSVRYRAAASMM